MQLTPFSHGKRMMDGWMITLSHLRDGLRKMICALLDSAELLKQPDPALTVQFSCN